jgi:hypothetical protein
MNEITETQYNVFTMLSIRNQSFSPIEGDGMLRRRSQLLSLDTE